MQETQVSPCCGYEVLLETLSSWGVEIVSGITGGGIIHLLKYLDPHSSTPRDPKQIRFFNIGEYVAGYIPLGYFLATQKIAAGIATTGAATKLLSCGLSDAKLHDIPAVYLVPLSSLSVEGRAPLQDTSCHGSNIVQQLIAELPQSVFILHDPEFLSEQLRQAKRLLDEFMPVVFVLSHDALSQPSAESTTDKTIPSTDSEEELRDFVSLFRQKIYKKRLIILIGEELQRYENASDLTYRLATALQAPTLWSLNGANAVSRDNPYGYGYISFGGNDCALELWQSLNEDDVLLAIGVCPDEYTVNLRPIAAGYSFFLTNLPNSYGKIDGSLRHFVQGEYHQLNAPLDAALLALIASADHDPMETMAAPPAPKNLNTRLMPAPRRGYVDMAKLYELLDAWWKPELMTSVCLTRIVSTSRSDQMTI